MHKLTLENETQSAPVILVGAFQIMPMLSEREQKRTLCNTKQQSTFNTKAEILVTYCWPAQGINSRSSDE